MKTSISNRTAPSRNRHTDTIRLHGSSRTHPRRQIPCRQAASSNTDPVPAASSIHRATAGLFQRSWFPKDFPPHRTPQSERTSATDLPVSPPRFGIPTRQRRSGRFPQIHGAPAEHSFPAPVYSRACPSAITFPPPVFSTNATTRVFSLAAFGLRSSTISRSGFETFVIE